MRALLASWRVPWYMVACGLFLVALAAWDLAESAWVSSMLELGLLVLLVLGKAAINRDYRLTMAELDGLKEQIERELGPG